jgi:adenine deaminase
MFSMSGTVQLGEQVAEDFVIKAPIEEGEITAHIIDCVPRQTLVTKGQATVSVHGGRVVLPADDDLAFICVVDRHNQHGGRAFGLVRGLGITHGALATTYAHDSHNLAVIGRSPAEMARAANAVIKTDGGIAVVDGETTLALMPLPVAGIISRKPIADAAFDVAMLGDALRGIGIDHPYWLMRISTFTLPVSSGLRITDLGLVDAKQRTFVSLF